jgi:multisubunit Na+/H+ antiporter MnhC subunit
LTRPIPNLNDPEERRAYRRELMGVARGLRRTGVALAVLGSALILVNAYGTPIPNVFTLAAIVAGFALMLVGIGVRTKYHKRRMRGQI